MKILVIAPFIPWPLTHGGRIRLFHLLRELARRHEVTLVALAEESGVAESPLQAICHRIITVPHRSNFVASFWRFIVGPNPYNVERFVSSQLLETVRALVAAERYDLAHLEMTLIWPAAAACGNLPVVLGTQNVESRILGQLERVCRNPLKRLLYRLETVKMRRFEEMAWRSSQLCLTVSEAERDEVIASGVASDRVVTIPNGVDLERFAFHPGTGGKRLLFLCGLDYHPNMDAARWLLDEIWPLIRRKDPEARLLLAGRKTDQLVLPAAAGISCLGDPEDVPACFAQADALLVPLRVGAGTRLKVLEAMAAGLPVVSTARGCEGTLARDGEHLLQAETPEDFASACQRLLADPGMAATMARAARRMVEENYSWTAIGLALSNSLEAVTGCKGPHGLR